jgi:hypothetical protein
MNVMQYGRTSTTTSRETTSASQWTTYWQRSIVTPRPGVVLENTGIPQQPEVLSESCKGISTRATAEG